VVAHGGAFFPVWADNSNSTLDNPDGPNNPLDIYSATVTVTPSGGGGRMAPAVGGGSEPTSKLDSAGLLDLVSSPPAETTVRPGPTTVRIAEPAPTPESGNPSVAPPAVDFDGVAVTVPVVGDGAWKDDWLLGRDG
jgi:hypothetical protein